MTPERQGKTEARAALVLAGSRGLGRAAADALAETGHRIALCARSDESLAAAADELAKHGTEVVPLVADVSSPSDLDRVFATVDSRFGRLDVLVANAGGPAPGGFMDVDDAGWAAAFELTLMSAVRALRLAVVRMRPQGYGRIVVIGSSSVRQPIDGLVLSNAFRPALTGVVKTLAAEVARDGITVNLVAPGRIDTDRVRQLDERRASARGISYDELRASTERAIPVGRYGRPDEAGALVAFLASESAAYVTGQTVLIDGGMVPSLP